MSLRFPKVLRSWEYRDPAEFVVFGLPITPARTAPIAVPTSRDRYYRAARRLHVKRLMKGRT